MLYNKTGRTQNMISQWEEEKRDEQRESFVCVCVM